MSVETTTVYRCDGCGREVGKGDLHKFWLTEARMDSPQTRPLAEARMDLCTECERKLHDAVFPLMSARQRANLEGIVR